MRTKPEVREGCSVGVKPSANRHNPHFTLKKLSLYETLLITFFSTYMKFTLLIRLLQQNTIEGVAWKAEICVPQFWGLGSPKSRFQPVQFPASYCVLTRSPPLLLMTLVSSWGPTFRISSKPNYLPKSSPSNTKMFEVRAPT